MRGPRTSRSDPDSRRAYTRWHYQQHKEAYKARARAHNLRTIASVRAWILAYLLQHPCVDCGEGDPIVLEFDHRAGEIKLFALGTAASNSRTLKAVKAEVAKCDVRCANCHRRKTYRERGRGHKG